MGIIKIENINYIPLHLTKETTNGYTLQNELVHGVIGEKGNADYHIYNALNIDCKSHDNSIINKPMSYYINYLDNNDNLIKKY